MKDENVGFLRILLYSFNAFSNFNKAASLYCAHNFCSLKCDRKTNMNFFFVLHNLWIDFSDHRS